MASSFFEGFADSFAKGQQQRKLREQLKLEDAREQRRETIQQEQFQQRRQDQEKQFQAMENFRAKQNEFRAQQMGLQQRAADLEFVKGFSKIFDPKTTKGAKKLMLGTMATHLGIDRKGQQFKDLETYLSGMEEEEQKNFGAALMAAVPNAQPGQIKAMTKAMFTEGLTVVQAADLLDKATKKQTIQKINEQFDPLSKPSGSQLLAPQSLGEAQPKLDILQQRRAEIQRATEKRDALLAEGLDSEAGAQQRIIDGLQKAGEFEPETRRAIKSAEIKAEEEAELDQLVRPNHLRAIGALPTAKITKRQAREAGVDIDLDKDTIMKINQTKATVHYATKQIDELSAMIKPGTIGKLGDFVRGADSVIEQVLAIPNIAGMDDKQFSRAAAKIEVDGLPEKSAVIKSKIINLARSMAKAREVGKLSDRDVQDMREELVGSGGSIEQTKAVLDDVKERLRSNAAVDIEADTGVIPFDLMTKDELTEHMSEMSDDNPFLDIMEKEIDRRIKRAKR